MKIVHINLCARLNPAEGAYCKQRAGLEKLFWSDHLYPEKPDTASDPPQVRDAKLQAYRNAKAALQLEWIHMLESWTVLLIRRALEKAIKIDREKNAVTDLYLVTLPESYWCDTEPPGRLHIDPAGRAISDYHNPLYETSVADLLFYRTGEGTLSGLSAANIAIFAGTIWWKSTNAAGQDTIYNTAPVFHNSACQFLWDKQLLSKVDGLGSDAQNRKLHKWFDARNTAFSQAGLPAAANIEQINDNAMKFIQLQRRGFISPLTARLNHHALPQFNLTTASFSLSIGLDICKDFIGAVSHQLLPAPPHIQVVLSNGVAFRNPVSFYATAFLFVCDMAEACLTTAAVDPSSDKSIAVQLNTTNSARPLADTIFLISPQLDLV